MSDAETGSDDATADGLETDAVLEPVPVADVTVDDAFWSPRLETNREVSLVHQYEMLVETGRLDNVRRAAGDPDGAFEGARYNDSDVYKWLEAASNAVAAAADPDPDRLDRLDEVVDLVAAAQTDAGYLNTYYQLEFPAEKRFTDLRRGHELYCLGHLIEAGIAHRRATGEDRLFEVATRAADHVCDVFGPDGHTGYPGHEEIELALVALYRETGEQRYLDTAAFFVDQRGREDSRFAWEIDHPAEVAGSEAAENHPDMGDEGYVGRYRQDHEPVREQDTVDGHAVRAMYLYCGMADVAAETGDEGLLDALERLWGNMTGERMYVTGGIGATSDGEAFGDDYELPNASAYAETCAAVGSIRWNDRLLRLSGEGRFGDVIERTLYNGLLAGVGRDGTSFFYANPLASDGDRHRSEWFATACCPPNAARTLAELPKYVYLRGDDALVVDLYVGSTAETTVDGTGVTVTQQTEYPWDGTVELDVEAAEPTEFALRLRDPWWADGATVTVDGEAVDPDREDGFLVLDRTWDDAAVTVSFDMTVDRVAAHPEVDADRGRVALRRGPLVYCVEETDVSALVDWLQVPDDADLTATHRADLLGGTTVLEGAAVVPDSEDWTGSLYRSADDVGETATDLVAVPYALWDNRDPGAMRVWLPRRRR